MSSTTVGLLLIQQAVWLLNTFKNYQGKRDFCSLRCMAWIRHEMNHETAAVVPCDSTQNTRVTDSCFSWQLCVQNFPFITALTAAVLSNRKPASTWTSRDCGCAQGHDKRNALYSINEHQKLEFSNWKFRSNGRGRLTKTNFFRCWYQKRFKICRAMTRISVTNMHRNTCPSVRKPWLLTVNTVHELQTTSQ